MAVKFTGTGVAVVTPFHIYGTIEFTSLEKIIEYVINGGVDYILVLGITSEAAALSKDEKNAIINFFIETVNKRVPVMLGIGGNNTQEVINNIKSFSFEDIDAILSVIPYYNKPQQKGIYYHYKTIASACPVPMFLHNVPSRSCANISAETTLRLAEDVRNIVGIKECSDDLVQIMEIIKNKPKDFLVISGNDALILPLLSIGADGVISVIANAFPGELSEIVNLGLKGQFDKAREKHFKLLEIINTLFEDGNPSGIKAALDILGLCKNNLRLPLVKVNKAVYNKLSTLIEEFSS